MFSDIHAQFAYFIWSICNLLRRSNCLVTPTMVTRTDSIPFMLKGLTA